MKMQVNFHKRTGLKPSFKFAIDRYGKGATVYTLRLWWSALTLVTF